ncbi:MAG: GNAT family N-acetyltransferase [Prevotella sp.]|jgi:Acetyltransferases, including N-acetylases of ribosomal proteins|nr:GNAT family N-acetyltransferase [Prevotella sp.]MBQ1588163.1 GNAT family N-acetyltransferase [Prevotella sp.]MBQ1626478.1 GNAT family N-acetyltransferase [Prevotella sp.]MBQ1646071.1 GNAT family N-acetyltransferase [Prevotella sp.]MBQ1666476.1 GNAT family N-acetyltransferase [Prevotella sp.]
MNLPIVKLRAMEPEDLDLLYQIENDSSIWHVGTNNVPYSRYVLHDYIAHASGDIYTDKEVRMMIDNEQGETVGIVDLVNFSPQHQRAEIGIVIKDGCRNLGYANAAIRKIMSYAHDVVHLHQLYAIVEATNEISLNLFESLGFSRSICLKEWTFNGNTYVDAIVIQKFLNS